MTTYARFRSLVEVADNPSFLRARQHEGESSSTTADESSLCVVIGATATVSLAHLTSCVGLSVVNKSTTASVFAQWYSILGTRTNPGGAGYVIADANPDTITDGTGAGTMLTSGAALGRHVRTLNAEDAGNVGLWLMQNATTNVLTLASPHALVANAQDTTMTLQFEQRNCVLIPPLGVIAFRDTIDPVTGLTLAASAGSALCEVSFVGA